MQHGTTGLYLNVECHISAGVHLVSPATAPTHFQQVCRFRRKVGNVVGIVLHAGFHKSGTTSLQLSFQQISDQQVVFPTAGRIGPGHAALAGQLGRNPQALLEAVGEIVKKDPSHAKPTVVFSSENFHQYMPGSGISRLAEEYPVHLVLTRRPVGEALVSLHQEEIKQGATFSLMSSEGLEQAARARQFDVNEIEEIVSSAQFEKVTVISTSRDEPAFVFEAFSLLLGVTLESRTANSRLPIGVVEKIVELNQRQPSLSIEERIVAAQAGTVHKTLGGWDLLPDKQMIKDWELSEMKIVRFLRSLAAADKIAFLDSKAASAK